MHIGAIQNLYALLNSLLNAIATTYVRQSYYILKSNYAMYVHK